MQLTRHVTLSFTPQVLTCAQCTVNGKELSCPGTTNRHHVTMLISYLSDERHRIAIASPMHREESASSHACTMSIVPLSVEYTFCCLSHFFACYLSHLITSVSLHPTSSLSPTSLHSSVLHPIPTVPGISLPSILLVLVPPQRPVSFTHSSTIPPPTIRTQHLVSLQR
jgi:hypothetical protein